MRTITITERAHYARAERAVATARSAIAHMRTTTITERAQYARAERAVALWDSET